MAIRIILLIISLAGYGYFLYRKFELKVELIPFILFCSIGLTMVIAGILNCMELSVAVIFTGGFVLLGYSILSKKLPKKSLIGLITPGTIFFVVTVAWFSVLFIGLRYTEYDNFTHWGLIVKNMLAEKALPSFKNPIINHQTYPVGSSVFIYYIVKITGNFSEASTIMAQVLLMISSVTTIFSFVNCKKLVTKICMSILVSFSALMLICIGGYTTSLIVDALLPLCAVAVFCVILFYRQNIKRLCVISAILIPYIYMIKAAGILFVAFYIVLILIFFIRELCKLNKDIRIKHIRANWVRVFICIAMPFIIMFIWNKHVEMVYESSETSTHAISSEYFADTLSTRTEADKKEITTAFLNKVTSLDFTPNKMLIYLNLAVIIIGAAMFAINKKLPRYVVAVLVFANLAYILYMISLYGMYMISMPLSGAKTLSSLNRYCNTILTYIAGLFTVSVAVELDNMNDDNKNMFFKPLLLGVFCISILFTALKQNPTTLERFYKKPVYNGSSAPERIEAITRGVKIDSSESYFVYMPSSKPDNGYSKYIFRYNLLNKNYTFSTNFDNNEEMLTSVLECKYLFIVDKSDELTDFAIENRFEQIKPNVFQILS